MFDLEVRTKFKNAKVMTQMFDEFLDGKYQALEYWRPKRNVLKFRFSEGGWIWDLIKEIGEGEKYDLNEFQFYMDGRLMFQEEDGRNG